MYLKESSELGTVLAPHPFRSPFLHHAAYLPFDHVNDGITVSAVEAVSPPVSVTSAAAVAAAAAAAVAAATSIAGGPVHSTNGLIAAPLPKVSISCCSDAAV
jgi:hypothetical protein